MNIQYHLIANGLFGESKLDSFETKEDALYYLSNSEVLNNYSYVYIKEVYTKES